MNTISIPPRQQIAFPTVAYVRKGKPKIKISKDGREYEALAKDSDLKNKFRVHFLPGTAAAKAVFHNRHASELVQYKAPSTIPDGYEVEEIRAIIPSVSVWSSWRQGNTANNAGREIARADDTHYITKRDPLNGKYIVRNGEPYTRFVPGEVIRYERNGKQYEIPLKSNGQLRIVCADMVEGGQLVEFVLKTSSFYDCQQIRAQLAAIQTIADTVNGGNAAGIPLRIFRMKQEILWNHADGTATRPESWLINIQAEPEWVKNVFKRMGKMALTGGEAAYLPSGVVQGNVNPHMDGEEFDSEDEIEETESTIVDDEESPAYTNVIEWLIQVHKINVRKHAENMANLLNLNSKELTPADWERRMNNYLSMRDAGNEPKLAAKLTLESEKKS